MGLKHEKVKVLLREFAADFVSRESNKKSLITVTRTDISKDYKKSTIFVTTLPESAEKEAVTFLNRKKWDFREFVKKKSKLRIIPEFDFKIDQGEKARQRLDEISNKQVD